MCDKWFRIQSALCDQPQYFLTIAAVYTAGLEGEVLAVHIRQRQSLSLVIKSNDRHDRIWSCTFPCKAKRGFGACDFKNDICSAMVTVGTNIICTSFG